MSRWLVASLSMVACVADPRPRVGLPDRAERAVLLARRAPVVREILEREPASVETRQIADAGAHPQVVAVFAFAAPLAASAVPGLRDCGDIAEDAPVDAIAVHVDVAVNRVLAAFRVRSGGPDCSAVALLSASGEDLEAGAADAVAVAAADRRLSDLLLRHPSIAVVTATPSTREIDVTFYFEPPIDPGELSFEHCAPHHRRPEITGLVSRVRPAERRILGVSPQWDGRVHCL